MCIRDSNTHGHLQLITPFSFRSDATRDPWLWPRNVRVGRWAAFQLARLGAPGVPHHCALLVGSDSSSSNAATAPVPPATTALSWPNGLWRWLFQLRLRLGTQHVLAAVFHRQPRRSIRQPSPPPRGRPCATDGTACRLGSGLRHGTPSERGRRFWSRPMAPHVGLVLGFGTGRSLSGAGGGMQRLDTCSCSSCSRVGGIAMGRCPRAFSPTNCGRAYLALAVRHRGARAEARRRAPASFAVLTRGRRVEFPQSEGARFHLSLHRSRVPMVGGPFRYCVAYPV